MDITELVEHLVHEPLGRISPPRLLDFIRIIVYYKLIGTIRNTYPDMCLEIYK